jgi:hypothetical protein
VLEEMLQEVLHVVDMTPERSLGHEGGADSIRASWENKIVFPLTFFQNTDDCGFVCFLSA